MILKQKMNNKRVFNRGEFMKKRKGATLIYVIVIFSFLIVTAVGLLSMVVVNYRGRISESDRIENLYASESGLDTAYNITGKTIEGGVKYGFYQVSEVRCGGGESSDEYAQAYKDLCSDIEELEEKKEEIREAKALYLSTTEDDEDTIAERVKEFDKEIAKCTEGQNTDVKIKKEVLKEEFKRAFKKYIYTEGKESFGTDEDVLKASILNKAYVDVSLTTTDAKDSEGKDTKKVKADYSVYYVEDVNEKDEKNKERKESKIEVEDLTFKGCEEKDSLKVTNKGGGSDVETHLVSVSFYKTENEYFNLKLLSTFNLNEENTNTKMTSGERKIRAAYKILVPNYNDVLFSESTGVIPDYKLIGKMRGITVGGDMNIKNTDLDVIGDVFVQGKDHNNTGAFEKYLGGINIDSGNVSFLPLENNENVSVAVRKTFNIEDNVNVNAGKATIYAGNVYVGDIENDGLNSHFVSDSSLNAKDIITDNDLALYAVNSNVNMDGFYGINDKSYDFEDGSEDNNKNISKTSSSILINGHIKKDGTGASEVRINKEAYILGVAHINTAKSYKTGESIAVKGNYTAYAVPVNPDETFIYDAPLQLLDSNDVTEKANHFTEYWKGQGSDGIKIDEEDALGNKKKADNGGIILPSEKDDNGNLKNVYTIGAIVCAAGEDTNNTYVGNTNTYSSDSELKGGTVYEKRSDYAEHVFCLGVSSKEKEEGYYYSKYLSGAGNADTVGNDVLSRLNSVDEDVWNEYNFEDEMDKQGTSKTAVLFNADSTKTIKIEEDTQGVIVTNGDVEIGSNVTFVGDIICKGDLNVKSGGHCKIEYDVSVIETALTLEPELFKEVFAFEGDKNLEEEKQETIETTTVKQVLEGKYDIKKYLKKKIWQLVQ